MGLRCFFEIAGISLKTDDDHSVFTDPDDTVGEVVYLYYAGRSFSDRPEFFVVDATVSGPNQGKPCMYTPSEGKYVQGDDTLEMAIHQFIVGHHQSLLVARGEDIVGAVERKRHRYYQRAG